MEFDIIINGKISTKDKEKFLKLFEKSLADSNSSFRGNIQVLEFDDFEEIKDDLEK